MDGPVVLSSQSGCVVYCWDGETIQKIGSRVRKSEEVALVLVQHDPKIPSPRFIASTYEAESTIYMSVVPGSPLKKYWDRLDNGRKQIICQSTWAIITRLQRIGKPSEFDALYQCSADGSPTQDKLLKSLDSPARPIVSENALKARIAQRYYKYNGRKYTMEELMKMLPSSPGSVFTHGDIAPRNIMVDSKMNITGFVDWEEAGWYPTYWEYANIMKPSSDRDWQAWMDATAPANLKCDLSGFNAARRVLF